MTCRIEANPPSEGGPAYTFARLREGQVIDLPKVYTGQRVSVTNDVGDDGVWVRVLDEPGKGLVVLVPRTALMPE
jgi:hypothetical protein